MPPASHFAALDAVYFEHPVFPSLRQTLLHASLQGESIPVEGLPQRPSGCVDLLPMLCRSINQRGNLGPANSAEVPTVDASDWSSGAVATRLAPHRAPCQGRRIGEDGVEVSVCLLANVQRTAKVDHRVLGAAAWNTYVMWDVSKFGAVLIVISISLRFLPSFLLSNSLAALPRSTFRAALLMMQFKVRFARLRQSQFHTSHLYLRSPYLSLLCRRALRLLRCPWPHSVHPFGRKPYLLRSLPSLLCDSNLCLLRTR